ncbi:MAG: addiction module protein [Limisphaerales bacterium]
MTDFPALKNLSKAEKLQLVEDLWDEIAALPDDWPISPEEIALLDKRLAAHRAAPEEALSMEQFKLELAARL